MQRHHTGSGRRRVIPADWAAHHRPAVEDTLTATCAITHAATSGTRGAFDKATGTYADDPSPADAHYTGPCSVVGLTHSPSEQIAADEDVAIVQYLVEVAVATAPETRVGDTVAVSNAGPNGDPSLVGRDLVVQDFTRGTY